MIASVPDDKLLLESDLEDAKEVRGALLRMLQVIAGSLVPLSLVPSSDLSPSLPVSFSLRLAASRTDAKGWTLDYAAKKTWDNAETFYSKT